MSIITTVHASNLGDNYSFSYIGSLGELLSLLGVPIFSIATVIVVIYMALGIFRFITSAGDKNTLAQARGQITHSIIGFIILIMVFLIVKFLPEFLGLQDLQLIPHS